MIGTVREIRKYDQSRDILVRVEAVGELSVKQGEKIEILKQLAESDFELHTSLRGARVQVEETLRIAVLRRGGAPAAERLLHLIRSLDQELERLEKITED